MDKVKTLLFTMLGVIIAVAVIGILISVTKTDIDSQTQSKAESTVASSTSTDEAIENAESEESIEIEQAFLFMEMRYVGNNIEGSLVDCNGRRYQVTVEDPDRELTVKEFYEKALELYYNADSEQWLPKEDMGKLYQWILRTDDNFGFSISEESYDTDYFLYCIQDFGVPFLIEIYSEGASSDLPTNRYSIELYNYFMDINGTPERRLEIIPEDDNQSSAEENPESSVEDEFPPEGRL